MSGSARDTRKHPRHNLEVPVMISDAAKRVRKPIRFSSGDISSLLIAVCVLRNLHRAPQPVTSMG